MWRLQTNFQMYCLLERSEWWALLDKSTANDIMSLAEHTRMVRIPSVITRHNCFLTLLVNHVLKVCRSREWYKELKYYLLSNGASSRSMGRFSAASAPVKSLWRPYSMHTAALLWGEWERGTWYIRHIMVSVAVTLSTYAAMKPRTKWTSSWVKSIHRSYKRIYGVCNGVW